MNPTLWNTHRHVIIAWPCAFAVVGLLWGALKMTDMKLQDMEMADKIAGHENARREIAGRENAGHEIARQLELCTKCLH